MVKQFQEWMIFPGHATQGKREAMLPPSAHSELVRLATSVGDEMALLFGKAMTSEGAIRDDAASRPTMLFFYGNAMCLADAVPFCLEWRKLGANVAAVEYPGYGMSSGKPGETPFYAAADAAYDYLLRRPDIDSSKLIPTGLSIGTGPATDLASRKTVAALILFAPYTSLDDLARSLFPWMPVAKLLQHHFPNEQKIAGLSMPILIVHGRKDSIIPTEMSQRLARAAIYAQVTTLLVDTDHNDLFEEAGEQLNAALHKLIEQVAVTIPTGTLKENRP